MFEQVYLLKRLDVWTNNRLSRVLKTPKLQFLDAGLLAAMLEISADALRQDRMRLGGCHRFGVSRALWPHSG